MSGTEPRKNIKGTEDDESVKKGSIHEEFKESKEVSEIISTFTKIHSNQTTVELTMERLLFILDEYQEQPHLLDPHLERLLSQLLTIVRDKETPEPVLHLSFRAVYLLMKVRGPKYMVRLMPHEVADFEPVLSLLEQQKPTDHTTWESRYVLLFWLGVLSMIPFDLSRFDKQTASGDTDPGTGVMHRLLNQAESYLQSFDKCRDAAAFLMSKFLSRVDVKQQRLEQFVTWALDKITKADKTVLLDVQQIVGPLRALGLMFKHGKRQELLPYADRVMTVLQSTGLRITYNTLLRHLIVKLVQRIGLMYLPYRVATWRYQRGSRSLAVNLESHKPTSTSTINDENQSRDEDEEYDVPEEMEPIIEELLSSLKDKDTIVRWSAAKGVGRITGRLPRELADEVVGWLLDMFTLRESDVAWHGGCLALAELGRRGLLLPNRLPDVVPVVLRALSYDERRGNQSVGAHVRDAACYVSWAFARAYNPSDLKAYVEQLGNALVMLTLFDREVNVRRAAAAAFQENVGRQGLGTFAHGIDIQSTCSITAVARIAHCYTELAMFVAEFREYTVPMVDFLYKTKAQHWDESIRKLCCETLGKVTAICPDHMVKTVLPALISEARSLDLFTRHGALLCIAEITLALSELALKTGEKLEDRIGAQLVDDIQCLPKKAHDANQLRGISGEYMRKAVCLLIDRVSRSRLRCADREQLQLWQQILDDCLSHLDPEIRQMAAQAVPSLLQQYFISGEQQDNQHIADVVERYVNQLRAPLEPPRLGHTLALGQLPHEVLQRHFRLILSSLMAASQPTVKDKALAEARAAAVTSLSRIVLEVGVSGMAADVLPEVYDCLFVALSDYTIDSRGDIGAFVREASMQALHRLTSAVIKSNRSAFSKQLCHLIFSHLCQQAVEKIDRTRNVAGEAMYSLLYHDPPLPFVPHEDDLKTIFNHQDCDELNWAVESKTFPLFVRVMSLSELAYPVTLGLTVSVGGLTESLVRSSWLSLWQYLQNIDPKLHRNFVDNLIKIFKDNSKVDRVTIPMLKFLHKLLSNCVLADYADLEGDDAPLKLIFELTKQEVARSKDPIKLIAGIDVFCDLLTANSEVRSKTLFQLMIFLCHRYPRIRKTTAQVLYESLLVYDDVLETNVQDSALTLLSDTRWDEEISKVKPVRNELCDLMGIQRPVVKKVES